MRIAVISDSHNQVPGHLVPLLEPADEIWHLGDVIDPKALVEIELLNKPMVVVAGNCDGWPSWPLRRQLKRGGHVFHLEHIAPLRPPRGVDAVINGHTHIPDDKTDQFGVRWLNPGSVSEPRYKGPPSFAWLTLDETRDRAPYTWEITFL